MAVPSTRRESCAWASSKCWAHQSPRKERPNTVQPTKEHAQHGTMDTLCEKQAVGECRHLQRRGRQNTVTRAARRGSRRHSALCTTTRSPRSHSNHCQAAILIGSVRKTIKCNNSAGKLPSKRHLVCECAESEGDHAWITVALSRTQQDWSRKRHRSRRGPRRTRCNRRKHAE